MHDTSHRQNFLSSTTSDVLEPHCIGNHLSNVALREGIMTSEKQKETVRLPQRAEAVSGRQTVRSVPAKNAAAPKPKDAPSPEKPKT